MFSGFHTWNILEDFAHAHCESCVVVPLLASLPGLRRQCLHQVGVCIQVNVSGVCGFWF